MEMHRLLPVIGLSIASAALAYDPLPGPSPYGPYDEAGATNTQTPSKVKAMAKRVLDGEGIVYRLGHEYENGMPAFPGTSWDLSLDPPLFVLNQVAAVDLFHGSIGQQGTQLDALGHFGYMPLGGTNVADAVFYNQFTGDEILGSQEGLRHLGVEQLKPMVTRAILLDVRHTNGGVPLAPGQEITMAMFNQTLSDQGLDATDIKKGDAVLIYTGHEELWEQGTFGYYIDAGFNGLAEPGLGLPVAEFLASRQITCVGSDNWGIEVVPNFNAPFELGIVFPVHHELLIKHGIPLQESMHLGELAEDVRDHFVHLRSGGMSKAKAGKEAFIVAYISNPVPMKGATGSPGVPLAIR